MLPLEFCSALSTHGMTMASSPMDKPFGAWESPITSKSITAGSVRLGGLTIHDNTLYWLEGRPQEGGRQVLCTNTGDILPKDSNARTRVHEYGGAAVTMGQKGTIFFSEFATQRLCCLKQQDDSDAVVEPITPDGNRYRFADGDFDEANNQIICVREDHLEDGKASPQQVVNEIVSVNTANGSMKVLATGNDFYAAPRLSPDGTKLAYITWNHPNMPWDATELRVVNLAEDSSSTSSHVLLAGSDKDTSIMQPKWHPQTGDLYYISDQSGFYNIYRATLSGESSSPDESILPMEVDFGGAAPGWALGQQGFTFLADGRLISQYKKDGESVLLLADVKGDSKVATNLVEFGSKDGLPMQFGGIVVDSNSADSSAAQDVYFLGGSPSTPSSIYKWNLETKGPAEILKKSSTLSFPDSVISVPQQVEFPTTLGKAYGYYYPPKNGDYQCTTESAPPLLVKAHGGPTACTGTSFNAGIQFWTSRGFAVLDVDYGGSTGYGRDYRRRLRGSWGIVDMDDVCNGATHLVKEGLADGDRLCIDGGSAGGYTTLGALAFKDVFKAGCSLYGVGDLTALARDTHKFESRYLDGLVGPYPEAETVYKERSPIESTDKLSCPILLLQGSEDKIVPPNQAEMMHQALLEKGIPTCLKIYEGEQHGFRKAENIEDALDSELAFYGKVFGIDVPGAVDMKIDNLK